MLAECSLYAFIRNAFVGLGGMIGKKRNDKSEGEGGPYNSCSARQSLLRLCCHSVHSGPDVSTSVELRR
jgi:hypothetical protein